MKLDIWGYFEYLSRKFKLHDNQTSINGTLHVDQYTLFIISRSVLLRIRNAVYEIMWKNIVEADRPQMTI